MWGVAKASKREVYSDKCKAYIKKKESSQISYITLHLKELEKEQAKPKVSRRKQIIKIKAEMSEIEKRKTIEKMNKTKSSYVKKA